MKSITKESWGGIAGTIVFHILLILFGILYTLDTKAKVSEYVELSFTSSEMLVPINEMKETGTDKNLTNIIKSSNVTKSIDKTPNKIQNQAISYEQKGPIITPPRYNISLDDGEVRLPDSKIDVSSNEKYESKSTSSGLSQSKENFIGSKKGDENKTEGKSLDRINDIGNSNIGKEIKSFSISWRDGGYRNKVSGIMPKYPENMNKEAQIKLQITVSPDGTILQIVPLQKADFAFESAAINALKTWKFDKLKPNQPKENQTGIITFIFKLD